MLFFFNIWGYSYFYFVLRKFSELNRRFTLKTDSDARDCVSVLVHRAPVSGTHPTSYSIRTDGSLFDAKEPVTCRRPTSFEPSAEINKA
jgi:hypothetical protein